MYDILEFHLDPNLPENYVVLEPDAEGEFVIAKTDIAAPLETFHGSYPQLVKMLRDKESLLKPKPQKTK